MLPPNCIFPFSFFFLTSSVCRAVVSIGFPLIASVLPRLKGRCDVFLRLKWSFRLHVKSWGSTLCEAMDGSSIAVSGRKGGKPHKTLHSRDQMLFSVAALISTDAEAQAIRRFNLDVICPLKDNIHVLTAGSHTSKTLGCENRCTRHLNYKWFNSSATQHNRSEKRLWWMIILKLSFTSSLDIEENTARCYTRPLISSVHYNKKFVLKYSRKEYNKRT